MNNRPYLTRYIPLIATSLGIILGQATTPQQAIAQGYVPNPSGRPGRYSCETKQQFQSVAQSYDAEAALISAYQTQDLDLLIKLWASAFSVSSYNRTLEQIEDPKLKIHTVTKAFQTLGYTEAELSTVNNFGQPRLTLEEFRAETIAKIENSKNHVEANYDDVTLGDLDCGENDTVY